MASRLSQQLSVPISISTDVESLLLDPALPKPLEPEKEQAWKETQLRRNAAFIRRVLESNQDCIKVLDLDGRLLYMNTKGQEIMEVDDFSGKAKGLPWLSFWQGDDQAAARAAFESACRGDGDRFDGYCATAKGTPKWWEVAVTPILDEQGEVSEVLSVSRDITARKTAELALQVRNQELNQFTRMVSHDLKAPLRGVASLAEWITEDLGQTAPEKTQEHLALLQERVGRMQGLVDGLLQLSRLGQENILPEPIDVSELLAEVLDSITPPTGFEIAYTTDMPKLTARRLLLSQVLTNCIGNAVKHHDKEAGRIEVSAQDKGSFYRFEIADDGPGIPESERERVFEMFQTLAEDDSTHSTGIGLALVKKIIAGEGGELWVEPHTPRGCKFCFTWPKDSVVESTSK